MPPLRRTLQANGSKHESRLNGKGPSEGARASIKKTDCLDRDNLLVVKSRDKTAGSTDYLANGRAKCSVDEDHTASAPIPTSPFFDSYSLIFQSVSIRDTGRRCEGLQLALVDNRASYVFSARKIVLKEDPMSLAQRQFLKISARWVGAAVDSHGDEFSRSTPHPNQYQGGISMKKAGNPPVVTKMLEQGKDTI